ncbi:unnamed protein product [Phaeothamnion confervicola]
MPFCDARQGLMASARLRSFQLARYQQLLPPQRSRGLTGAPSAKGKASKASFLEGVVVFAVPHADALTIYKIKKSWQLQVTDAGGELLPADQDDAAAVPYIVVDPDMPPVPLAASLYCWPAMPAAVAAADRRRRCHPRQPRGSGGGNSGHGGDESLSETGEC